MSDGSIKQSWQLVGDIGGTNARFARKAAGSNDLVDVLGFSVSGHEKFTDALAECLDRLADDMAWTAKPDAACFAVASRPDQEKIRFTNSSWTFSRSEVQEMLNGSPLVLINDFAANGYGITEIADDDWQQVGGGDAVPDKPMAILGPGTGLGVSLVVPAGESFVVVDGEGGHVDFAPINPEEYRILEMLKDRFGRVSVERLLCGPGILNIYQVLAEIRGQTATLKQPEEITLQGQSGKDYLAIEALKIFCRVLGSTAGNLALTTGAQGGVYITGGIIPAMLGFFMNSEFRERFEAKGRFREYLEPIPVRVVTRQDLGLLGSANRLALEGY